MDKKLTMRSILTAFGGSVRFNAARPPMLNDGDLALLGAYLGEDRTPMVQLRGSTLDNGTAVFGWTELANLNVLYADRVLSVLKQCLVPENIRICIGDVINVNRGNGPFFLVVTDTCGVALSSDTRDRTSCGLGFRVDSMGRPESETPEFIYFGVDDYDVVGHEEFVKGILDIDSSEDVYASLEEIVSKGERPGPCNRRHRAFTGESALEKAYGRKSATDWGLPEGVSATVIEYGGIEALVFAGNDRMWHVHQDYAWKEGLEVKLARA